MITFHKISGKNFLSVGNHPIEFQLDKNHTTCLVGKNSHGKSIICDLITFGLFGKPYRPINKPQLVNSINEKDCLVELELSVGTTKWKVCRGIKPNIFEIYRDGKLLDQNSSTVDQQKWFEQSVLKMTYKSFTQIAILGTSNFIPFMQLSSANRREVIEDLLDIKIFSSMNIVVKDKIRQLKVELQFLEQQKESLSDKVKMQKNFIDEIEKRGKDNIQTKKDKILSLINQETSCGDENKVTTEKLEELNLNLGQFVGASSKLKKLGNLRGKLSQKISSIGKDYKFFNENTVCPTCTQELKDEFRQSKIDEFQSISVELEAAYKELESTINEEEKRENIFSQLSKEIVSLTHDISKNNTKISQYHSQIKDIQSEILIIEDQIQNRNVEHDKLEQFILNFKQAKTELLNKKEQSQYYEFSYNLLKDGGVKSRIIKKYLPLINQQVNRYLHMMDLYINFTLDEEFNEKICSPIYENFSYNSFSEGQKARINLALLFSWREIAKIKNSTNVSLLIFDEVFDGSLDSSGTDDFLNIIRNVITDANVFVISHKEGIQDKFDNVITFEKKGNFTHKTENQLNN